MMEASAYGAENEAAFVRSEKALRAVLGAWRTGLEERADRERRQGSGLWSRLGRLALRRRRAARVCR